MGHATNSEMMTSKLFPMKPQIQMRTYFIAIPGYTMMKLLMRSMMLMLLIMEMMILLELVMLVGKMMGIIMRTAFSTGPRLHLLQTPMMTLLAL